jgi:hypothetical protein
VKPVLQALLLAERVYEDKSGKKIIAGTFFRIGMTKRSPHGEAETADGVRIPTIMGGTAVGSPYAYISLTDVCDEAELSLQFYSRSRNQVLLATHIKVECNDRLETVEIIAALPELQACVPEPGIYALELLCEGEILGSHRIVAVDLDEGRGT